MAYAITAIPTYYGRNDRAYACSYDGRVVVGYTSATAQITRAFRWTPAGGTVDLGNAASLDKSAAAYACSSDGSIVFGYALDSSNQNRAFRWTPTTQMEFLPLGAGWQNIWSAAYGCSADGSVVVGEGYTTGFEQLAFRWTQAGGAVSLGTLDGWISSARACTSDASVVVGQANNAQGRFRAFRWTQAGGMVNLGTLGLATSGSFAYACSATDGSVVVGQSNDAAGIAHPFRWTQAGGMVDLTPGSAFHGSAEACSADGSIVFGWSEEFGAFRWTAAEGMTSLPVVGGGNAGVFACSPDGTVAAGYVQSSNAVAVWAPTSMQSDVSPIQAGAWAWENIPNVHYDPLSWVVGAGADGTLSFLGDSVTSRLNPSGSEYRNEGQSPSKVIYLPDTSLWIAVGEFGTGGQNHGSILTSPDGLTYTRLPTLVDPGGWQDGGYYRDISVIGSRVVVVGHYSTAVSTDSGVTWTHSGQLTGGATPPGLSSIASNGVEFVTVGDIRAGVSTDGLTFTSHLISTTDRSWVAVAWNGSVYCAVSQAWHSAPQTLIATSVDGRTWNTSPSPLTGAIASYSPSDPDIRLSARDGYFWLLSRRARTSGSTVGQLFSSPDGVNWKSHPLPEYLQKWSGALAFTDTKIYLTARTVDAVRSIDNPYVLPPPPPPAGPFWTGFVHSEVV